MLTKKERRKLARKHRRGQIIKIKPQDLVFTPEQLENITPRFTHQQFIERLKQNATKRYQTGH